MTGGWGILNNKELKQFVCGRTNVGRGEG